MQTGVTRDRHGRHQRHIGIARANPARAPTTLIAGHRQLIARMRAA
jgi:hypothetical protein